MTITAPVWPLTILGAIGWGLFCLARFAVRGPR